MTPSIRVLIVDDDPNVRRGLRMRLRLDSSIHVVGEAGDGEAGVRRAATLNPDVVVLDLSLPLMDGLSACRLIRASGIQVVVLSLEDDETARASSLAAGAAAFVSKQDATAALLAAIRSAAGESLTPPVVCP